MMKYGFIYREYTSQAYFWELIKNFVKLYIAFITTFYRNELLIKVVMTIIIVLTYIFMTLKY